MSAARKRNNWPSEMHRQRRGRNLALLAVLVVLALLFYVLTFVKMGGGD